MTMRHWGIIESQLLSADLLSLAWPEVGFTRTEMQETAAAHGPARAGRVETICLYVTIGSNTAVTVTLRRSTGIYRDSHKHDHLSHYSFVLSWHVHVSQNQRMYVLLSKHITISTPVEVFVGRDRAFSWTCNFAWVCQTTAWVGDPEITERVINALMRLCSISCTKVICAYTPIHSDSNTCSINLLLDTRPIHHMCRIWTCQLASLRWHKTYTEMSWRYFCAARTQCDCHCLAKRKHLWRGAPWPPLHDTDRTLRDTASEQAPVHRICQHYTDYETACYVMTAFY